MRGMDGLWGIGLAVTAFAALSGCASTFGGPLKRVDALNPAEGQVRFRRTPADNISISLSVKHLPAPQKLEPPAWAYVAWIRGSKGGSPLNLGALRVGDDAKGELNTITQLRAFEVFVTAEPTSAVETPSGTPLLWASRYE